MFYCLLLIFSQPRFFFFFFFFPLFCKVSSSSSSYSGEKGWLNFPVSAMCFRAAKVSMMSRTREGIKQNVSRRRFELTGYWIGYGGITLSKSQCQKVLFHKQKNLLCRKIDFWPEKKKTSEGTDKTTVYN